VKAKFALFAFVEYDVEPFSLENAVEPLIFADGPWCKQSCGMEAVHPVSEGKFYPIDPDPFEQCLLVFTSGYFF